MILFLILIVLASVAMALFILIQNPKGGGLAGNIAGFNSQFMGVKQTTDVLEKGTWVLAVVIALLCLTSALFIPRAAATGPELNARPNATQQAPASSLPSSAPAQPGK